MDKSKTIDDASPLTTSSESETFDSWTLITEKPKDVASDETAFSPLTPDKSDDDADNADEAVHVEAAKESLEIPDIRYNDLDDLSDGISIISESESAGRLSPHPELRKRLSELNMRFINVPEPPPTSTTENGSQTLHYDACSERSSDTFHRIEPLVESSRRSQKSSRQLIEASESTESTATSPRPHCGVRGLFYFGVLLALVAFCGKLKFDTWETMLGTKTDRLIEKVNELELNNNLMRAEIDILSKQVKYLTTLYENPKFASTPNKPKNSPPRENAFKAWSGNGDKIEEVTITPEDLKKPFKCDGHNNVDLAGMCIELKDPIDANNQNSINLDDATATPEPSENDFIESAKYAAQGKDNYAPHEHQPSDQYENKKFDKRDKKHSKNHSGESKDRREKRRSSEERDSSAERFKKSKDYKKNDKRSSAEYEKAKREADGYWQEKMMQHRENSRKSNDKHFHEKIDKNWYIERGDSREQARYDHKYRGTGSR